MVDTKKEQERDELHRAICAVARWNTWCLGCMHRHLW